LLLGRPLQHLLEGGQQVEESDVAQPLPGVRLEPVTAATNEAGTIVNPAGVSVNGVAVYRVDAVPAGIVPDEAIANVATGLLSTLRWGLPL